MRLTRREVERSFIKKIDNRIASLNIMRKRIGFIIIVLLFPIIYQGSLCFGQGIEIESGASITISGAASIEITDGGFINNGSYTKDSETTAFSGTAAHTIFGTSITDFYNLSNSNEGGITIESAARVTVSNNFTNTGLFTIDSDASGSGSLIVNGTSSGEIVFKRFIPTLNRWHFVSSPVSGQSIQSFLTDPLNSNIPNTGTDPNFKYAMMGHDDINGGWHDFLTSDSTGNLRYTKAYAARISSGDVLTFTGSPVTDSQSPGVIADSWNCLGNPFTSSLELDSDGSTGFLEANSGSISASYSAIYVWNEDAGYTNKNRNDYAPINLLSTQNSIQPGQGFLVYPTATSLAFNANMRAHSNEIFYKKSAVKENSKLSLQIENEENIANTDFYFIEGMTLGLDPGYDAGLFGAKSDLSLYSLLIEDNGIEFMIQALPDYDFKDMVIPLGLDCIACGIVTFSIEDSVNLPVGSGAILEDRELNIFTDLTKTSSYTFNVDEPLYGTGRFYLHPCKAQDASGIYDDILNARIFTAQKNLYISGQIESSWTVIIYDIMGRQHKSFQLEPGNSNVLNLRGLDDGIYIVLISDGILIQKEKILLK